ncbi:MAG: YraN family protein [Phycisphaerae bacterium]|nr:YraN family protein [Phycisphaerae bacterium]
MLGGVKSRWIDRWRAWQQRRSAPGMRAERAAARYLKRHGCRVLARNLRTRIGEVDILAQDRASGQVVIVEVKSAAADDPPPEQHLDRHKERKLSMLAADLVRRFGLEDRSVRFDVIGVVWPAGARRPTRLTHHVGAFESTL